MLGYVPWPIFLFDPKNRHLKRISRPLPIRFHPLDWRRELHPHLGVEVVLRLRREVHELPSISLQPFGVDGIVFAPTRTFSELRHLQPFRHGESLCQLQLAVVVVQFHPGSGNEAAPATPRVILWPHRQCSQKWWTADCRPRVDGRTIVGSAVHQQVALWGKITTTLVDSALQPLTGLERVVQRVPAEKKHVLGRATTKHRCEGFVPSKDRVYPNLR